jgi:Tc5 transposase DNA-binding domain
MSNGILLTGEILHQKWNAFANFIGVPEDDKLKLSNGWLGQFKERNGLRQMKQHGEAASANAETIENERKQVQELIRKYGYQLQDIFNMHETGHFYRYTPISSLQSLPLMLAHRMIPNRGLSD